MPVEKKYFYRSTQKNWIPGDILIWDATEKNQYGHVAIFLAYLGSGLLVFEQNGITQAGAEIQVRTRDNMLGYLRKR
jgi:hypothetical protein